MIRKYKIVALSIAISFAIGGCQAMPTKGNVSSVTLGLQSESENGLDNQSENAEQGNSVELPKNTAGNPMVSDNQNIFYGGDPSVLVDGDTVYLYTGHDASTDEEVSKSIYNIPEYVCYSSTDMVNWKDEGVVMSMDDVDWASGNTSAWASQVAKHFDETSGKDKYYLYYCSWDKTGKQSIGVAVSDSPTGRFVDLGEPLVKSTVTKPSTSSFNDIDPTVFIDTDEDGTEHRYLAWGNGIFYVCELNEDMVSVTDVNGDGKITSGKTAGEDDVIMRTTGLDKYTEAPWLYRRQDENGEYCGDYYLFFARDWRECMAYATTDDLLNGEWSETTTIMYPTSTSNTNHMAVFDFKGKSYFVYHNGSLPGGSGYRRSACIVELAFNDDGSIDLMEESAAGLSGETVYIVDNNGKNISHEGYVNSLMDSDYPYRSVAVGIELSDRDVDALWVLRKGKSNPDEGEYVSIESENKPGLYLTVNSEEKIVLCQDTKASEKTAKNQTFKTLKGLNGKDGSVSFESVNFTGKYITVVDGKLELTDGLDADAASFEIK